MIDEYKQGTAHDVEVPCLYLSADADRFSMWMLLIGASGQFARGRVA